MRAMIVAAGLGTRLRPLTELLPEAGRSRARHPARRLSARAARATPASREVRVNVHHLPGAADRRGRSAGARQASRSASPHEPELLDTGGGIARVADFLRESDPCLLIGGDMIVDLDVGGARRRAPCARGARSRRCCAAIARGREFGTIGVDRTGRMRRIGRRFDLGGEVDSGVYTWVNVVSARAFDSLPAARGVLPPRRLVGARAGARLRRDRRRGARARGLPLGAGRNARRVPRTRTSRCRALSYLDVDARARAAGVRFLPELVIGAGADVGAGRAPRARRGLGRRARAGRPRTRATASSRAVASMPCSELPVEGAA